MRDGRNVKRTRRPTGAVNRRTFFLGVAGTSAVGGLAGCLGGDDGDDSDGSGNGPANAGNETDETDPVTARFSWQPADPDAGESVTLDATGSAGDIAAYEWTFPGQDGADELTGATATRVFDDPGQVRVSLTVEGQDSQASTATEVIPVHGSVFDDLETVTAGLPEYERWLAGNGEVETLLRTDLERAQGIDAYGLEALEGSGGVPFPEIGTIAEALPANNGVVPVSIVPSLGVFYPFLSAVSVPDIEFDGDPVMQLEQASTRQPDWILILEGELDEEQLRGRSEVQEREEYAGFTVYTSNPDNVQQRPFAVEGATVVLPYGNQDELGEDRARLESTLDIATGEQSRDSAFDWVLEHCGDGAFLQAKPASESEEEESEGGEGGAGFGIDDEQMAAYRSHLEGEAGGAMVVDATETGRVTRTAFAFEHAADVPPASEFADTIAPGAVRTNVATAGRQLVVEAFWE
mgnify:CR=1 FL=1